MAETNGGMHTLHWLAKNFNNGVRVVFVGLVMVVLWFLREDRANISRRFDVIEGSIQSAITLMEKARKEDVGLLSSRLDTMEANFRQVRDEQMSRTTRIAAVEENAKHTTVELSRIQSRIDKISDDTSYLRRRRAADDADRPRSDRDRADEKPAPPVDLGLVPMLWHF